MFSKIKALLKFKGYRIFSRPYELNIVGLRSKNVIPNRFDDELHVFYMINPVKWEYHVFKITTDPGTFWLNNPQAPKGTAILPEGQYTNAYGIGLHKGQYKALVQAKPFTIVRDYNRDTVLDLYNGKKETGHFGINIHRANKVGTTKTVDKNSAGCQVFANASDFDVFMKLCEQHQSRFGNKFTYTLIDFRSVLKRKRKMLAFFLSLFTLAGVAAHQYMKKRKQLKISA